MRIPWLFLIGCLFLLASNPGSAAGETLVIPGTGSSQALLRALAVGFNEANPGNSVSIPDSIGSTGGIRALISGQAVLVRTARPLRDEEEASGVKVLPFARSPIVFVVNPSAAGISGLTSQEIRDIYSGRIRNWEALGGPERKIYPIMRDGGATFRAVTSYLPELASTDGRNVKLVFSIVDLIDLVESRAFTIGFAPLSLIAERKVTVLSLDGRNPVSADIQSDYPMFVRFFLAYRGELDGLARKFVDFVQSPAGREIIFAQKAIPIEITE